jgi:HK97 family phage portal protein
VFKRAFNALFPKLERSSTFPLSEWLKLLHNYGPKNMGLPPQGHLRESEGPPNDYLFWATQFYKTNSTVQAVANTRRRVFSQVTFKFRPKDSDGTEHSLKDSNDGREFDALDVLDNPGTGMTRSHMMGKALQDVDICGNSFWTKELDLRTGKLRMRHLRPDWIDIVLTAAPEDAVQSDVKAYIYYPGGAGNTKNPRVYLPEEICHWAPDPDPEAQFRGMAPMTSLIIDLQVDEAASRHRLSFFQRGAKPSFAVVLKDKIPNEEAFDMLMEQFEQSQMGVDNHYGPLFISAGADIIPIETDIAALDMQNVSGRMETHIANVFGVPSSVVGLTEGMKGSNLNGGNYEVTQRGWINQTMHPLWMSFCEAMENIVQPPKPTRRKPDRYKLWYSTADVSALNDDREERARIQNITAEMMDKLIREGWESESVKDYAKSGNIDDLKHTGLISVQLYDPNAVDAMGSNLAPGGNAPSEKPAQPNVDPKAGSTSKPPKEKPTNG